VLAAIAYIEKLQNKVVFLSRLTAEEAGGEASKRPPETVDNRKVNSETNNN
jgi:hypothetical protein